MQIPWEPREGSLFWLDWTGKCSLPSLLDDQPTVVQSSISEAIKTATFPVCCLSKQRDSTGLSWRKGGNFPCRNSRWSDANSTLSREKE